MPQYCTHLHRHSHYPYIAICRYAGGQPPAGL
ncbi:hypothetical protein SAMN04490204_3981 [Pseudomonas thivervalensis]|nr:hypothetical protein SAMN04490204_3981 [Pseudomonas thivervalensis]